MYKIQGEGVFHYIYGTQRRSLRLEYKVLYGRGGGEPTKTGGQLDDPLSGRLAQGFEFCQMRVTEVDL